MNRTSPYSTNDDRYLMYHWLLDKDESLRRYSHVLMVDASDVYFQRDPFKVAENEGSDLTVSQDVNGFITNGWMRNRLTSCYGKFREVGIPHLPTGQPTPLFNAGVWGGKINAVRNVLELHAR